MRQVVTDVQVVAIARTSQAWRWTQLHDAIMEQTGCCPSTARRSINRAVQFGLLQRVRGTYQAAGTAGTSDTQPCYRRLDRHQLLQVLAERDTWPYTAMLAELRQRLGAAETTVRTSVGYALDFGYLVRAEGGWALTQQARHQLARYGRLEGAEGFRFAAFLSGQPKRGFDRWGS
jgi:DeoR/GlpR family transcriptional regulator of sugar metabolism